MSNGRENFVPWGLRPVEDFVFNELENRIEAYGFEEILDNYKSDSKPTARSAWVRVCSNGKIPKDSQKRKNPPTPGEAPTTELRDGFIMHGVHGFNQTYGISGPTDNNNLSNGKAILGYDVYGEPHFLEDDEVDTFQNRPSPGVTSIESEFYGAGSNFTGLCRKVTIKWRANSLGQLNYLMPYFLSPMMSVVVEWGWNNYNPESLIDLTDPGVSADPSTGKAGSGLRGYFTNSKLLYDKIEKSNGNYDAFVGKIINFNFALSRDGTFDCTTEVVNTNYMLDGISTYDTSKETDENGDKKPAEILNFRNFVKKDNDIDNIFSLPSFFTRFDKKIKRTVPRNVSVDLRKIVVRAHRDKKFFYSKDKLLSVTSHKTNIEKKYMKFDVFVELLNYFYSKQLSQANSSSRITFLDIEDTKICAHPLIKSVNDDVLIPNKHAAKIWKKSKNVGANKQAGETLSTIKATSNLANSEYGQILYNLGEVIRTKIPDDAELFYEDLDHLINSGMPDRSFPRETSDGGPAGYWGYLKDIYISTDIIKKEVEKNNKYLQFLTAVLERVNESMSILSKFRIAPFDTQQNNNITIIDDNYFNTNDGDIKKSTVNPIFIGSSNSSFIVNAGLDVKLSAQVANQTLLGNAVYDYRDKSKRDVKTVREGSPGFYVYMDRLFGEKPAETVVEENSPTEDQSAFNTDTNIANFKHVQVEIPVEAEEISAATRATNAAADKVKELKQTLKNINTRIREIEDKLNPPAQIPVVSRALNLVPFAAVAALLLPAARENATTPLTPEQIGKLTNEKKLLEEGRVSDGDQRNGKKEVERLLKIAENELNSTRSEVNFLTNQLDGARDAFPAVGAEGIVGVTKTKRPINYILVENNTSLQLLFKDTQISEDDTRAMYIHNMIMPDTELSLEFLGIAGFRYLNTFTIDGVVEPYTYTKCIWQVDRVNHSVSGNNWKTSVVAKARPHRFFDKKNEGSTANRAPTAEQPALQIPSNLLELLNRAPTAEQPPLQIPSNLLELPEL